MLDLDAIEKTAREATPGPWEIYQDDESDGLEIRTALDGDVDSDTGQHIVVGGILIAFMGDMLHEDANAAHIASNSPDVTLALVARIRELEGALALARSHAPKYPIREVYRSDDLGRPVSRPIPEEQAAPIPPTATPDAMEKHQ